ncbi:hypothetical protein F3Y22_tig00112402pilonHSYRG00274 [Hibiscus syriacus]|uniref:CCHC-type domain-containing protein n=1 Tax=Hibiscus syriacus TaxID=106335 RepID=A0A6A2Y4V3_HIBSY|nr:hypothetical protein F3Y22_tig00112402pilonHSYRG00274 [Hibiscus syriacus]
MGATKSEGRCYDSSLPESCDTLVVALSNSAPEGKLTMYTISDSLLGEEARRMERGKSIHPEANIIENQGRNETHGRSKSRDPHQSRGRSKSRSKITCYYCGRMGHKKMECQSFKRDQKAAPGFSILVLPSMLHHMEVSSHPTEAVTLVRCKWEIKIVGIRDIILTTSIRCKLILKDVRHVPAMRLNLISAGKLDDDAKLCKGEVNHLILVLTDEGEPQSYKEAMHDSHKEEWRRSMQEEMQSLHENHTCELVDLPKGRRALKNKWVYRFKTEDSSSKPCYNAQLVVKGFGQKLVRHDDQDAVSSPYPVLLFTWPGVL